MARRAEDLPAASRRDERQPFLDAADLLRRQGEKRKSNGTYNGTPTLREPIHVHVYLAESAMLGAISDAAGAGGTSSDGIKDWGALLPPRHPEDVLRGGDPAAASATATLLRLLPSRDPNV